MAIPKVYSTTKRIIAPLQGDLQGSSTKAVLAALRNSVNHDNKQLGLVWQLLFENMPKNFLSQNGDFTYEEQVILNTLQLYAIHQQGNMTSVDMDTRENIDTLGSVNIQFQSNQYQMQSQLLMNHTIINKAFNTYKELINYLNQWNEELKEQKHYPSNRMPTYRKNVGQSLGELRLQYTDKASIDKRFNAMITANTYDELIHHLRYLIRLLKSKGNIKVDYPQLAQDLFWFLNSDNGSDKMKLSWSQSYYVQKENEND